METYYCYSANDKVIGMVSAPDGDTAWLLAREAQPDVAYIKRSFVDFGAWTTVPLLTAA